MDRKIGTTNDDDRLDEATYLAAAAGSSDVSQIDVKRFPGRQFCGLSGPVAILLGSDIRRDDDDDADNIPQKFASLVTYFSAACKFRHCKKVYMSSF